MCVVVVVCSVKGASVCLLQCEHKDDVQFVWVQGAYVHACVSHSCSRAKWTN